MAAAGIVCSMDRQEEADACIQYHVIRRGEKRTGSSQFLTLISNKLYYKFNMSEYPYEGKIHSDDRVNYKTVYSSDGIKIGKVEAAFADSFIVKLEKEKNMEIKYEIPRLDISSLMDDRIILKLKQSEIDEKYQTSSIKKGSK